MKAGNPLLGPPPAAARPGRPASESVSRRILTIGSLFAGVAAAFVGTFLFITISVAWDGYARSDTGVLGFMMFPFGPLFLSVFVFWITLPLTVPPALILGHLTPSLERLLGPSDLCWVQYGSGAGVGCSIMLALGLLVNGGEEAVIASIAGSLAGLVAVRTFRRFVSTRD